MRCRVAIEKRKTNKQRVDTQKLVNVQKRVQTQKSFQNLFGHENNYNGKAKEVYKSIEYALQNDSGGGLGETLKSILDVISRTTMRSNRDTCARVSSRVSEAVGRPYTCSKSSS